MPDSSANVYDQVLYPSYPLPQADPRRLQTLAVLHGLEPAPAEGCRLLEVGCGTGMNLLALATLLPGSKFVGIDLAAEPIRIGQANARELELDNLALHAGDIRSLDPSWGTFDYILAHGVYSWVPEEVRDALMRLCGQCLAQHGVAYVSYNTLPGGHLRRLVRDILVRHTRADAGPEARLSQARDLLHFLVHGIGADDGQAAAMRAEAERTAHHVDALLFHDDLADVNVPVYFGDFIAHARRFGLDYLVEADFNEGQQLELPDEALERLQGLDRVERAQYLDFLKCRRFRQTLLCRQETPRREPDAGAVRRLWISSDARPTSDTIDLDDGVEMEFIATSTGSTIHSREAAVKAAMLLLGAAWPASLSFIGLVEGAFERLKESGGAAVVEQDLAQVLLEAYATGLVELSVRPGENTAPPGSNGPCLPRLARWQLARGESALTSLVLRSIIIDEEETRNVLELADGQRTVAEIARLLPGVAVEAQIARLTRLSLLQPLPSPQS